MNKYNLITEFFSNPEDAVKFFVQLKELRITSADTNCIAALRKVGPSKWTYVLEWHDGKFIGEHIKPFKPSKDNIQTFNDGCKGMAQLLETYIDTGDMPSIADAANPFGDSMYKEGSAES